MKELIEKKNALSAEMIEKLEADDKEAVIAKTAEISDIDKEIQAKAEEMSKTETTVPAKGVEKTVDGDAAPVVEETPEEIEKSKKDAIEKTIKTAVEKYADVYVGGSDFKDVIEQLIEGSKMFKDVVAKLAEIGGEENPSQQIEKKGETKGTYDGMFNS